MQHIESQFVHAALKTVLPTVHAVLGASTPRSAGIFIGNLLAHTVGNLTDNDWQKVLRDINCGCGAPGCDCHLAFEALFVAIDDFRDMFKKKVAEGNTRLI